MPNFQTKEKDQDVQNPQPYREPLCKMSDGTSVNHYYFRDKSLTVEDVIKPGFFDFMRDTFRSGGQKGVVHKVTCHLGDAKEGLMEIDLHLVDAPTVSGGPVIMAQGNRLQRYLPIKK